MKKTMPMLALGALAILTLAPPAARAADLAGKATFEGPKPEKKAIKMDADAKCVAMHGGQTVYLEDIVVGEKGELKNAFVYIKDPPKGAGGAAPAEHAKLEQKGCSYSPRVQGIRAGQTLDVVNSDSLMHNIRSYPRINRPFNIGQPLPDTREKTFPKPENAIAIRCDIHPWMTAYLFVMDHPYFAVTGEDGAYTIKGLPPGEYTLVAWHERLGEQKRKIKVGDAAGKEDFTFKPKAE